MLFKELLKYRGWKVFQIHDMHICLLAIFYVMIEDNIFSPLNSLIIISSIIFYFMYVFLINDFVDWPYDIAAGKNRPVHKLSRNVFGGIIILVIFISALHLVYLKNLNYTIIYSLAYLFATFYSAPPARFKERGLIGIVTDCLVEKTLPVLAIFAFFNHYGIDTYIFLITSFLLQLVEIIKHQIYDYEADIKTGIHTFVVDIGKERATKIFRHYICPLTAVFVIILSSLFIMKIPYATYAVFMIALIVIIYSMIFLSKKKLDIKDTVFPLYMSPLYFLVNNAFPLFFSFILVLASPLNTIFLIVTLGSQYYLFEKVLMLIKEKTIMDTQIFDN